MNIKLHIKIIFFFYQKIFYVRIPMPYGKYHYVGVTAA